MASYYENLKNLEIQEFPEVTPGAEEIRIDSEYMYFTPSYHFRPSVPLMTEEIVIDLRDNNKTLLSVGAGPAYLERFLVSRLGVKSENITLADITDKNIPKGFKYHQFDSHQENWPEIGSFDYVIFPESVFLSRKDEYDINETQDLLTQILNNAIGVLNQNGTLRMTYVLDDTWRPIVDKIEDNTGCKLEGKFGLLYLVKN